MWGEGLLFGLPISIPDADFARSEFMKGMVVFLEHWLSLAIWILWIRSAQENAKAVYARRSGINPVGFTASKRLHMKG